MKPNLSRLWPRLRPPRRPWVIGVGTLIVVAIVAIIWLIPKSTTVESAMAAYKAGNTQQALDLFSQARDKNQISTAEGWNIYGNVLRDATRDTARFPMASEAYQKAIKADSGYEAAYRNLSYLHLDWSEAEQDPSKLQEAIDIIEKGYQAHPRSISMVEDLIMLYGKAGNSAKVAELIAIRAELLK
ncbi:MAG: hypothetical protein V1826_00960 [bacterium]